MEQNIKKYKNWIKEDKVIFNIFLCYYNEDIKKWKDYSVKFNNLKIDWWVKPNPGNPSGLAYQSILDTNDIKEAEKISNEIYKEFNNDVLIVISKGNVRKYEPVGQNNDKAFIKSGRFFDDLVRKKEKGVYIIE